MRLSSFRPSDIPPVKLAAVSGLSDIIVIGDPSRVGKPDLIQALLNWFHNPSDRTNLRLVVEATWYSERWAPH